MNLEFPIHREVVDTSQDIYDNQYYRNTCLGMNIVFIKMRSFYQILQWSYIDLHFDLKSILECNFNVYI